MARNPETDAKSILTGVWGAISPNRMIPVDPVRIGRELGIDVVEADLDQNVSGAITKRVGEDPTIILNRNDSHVRQRFTAAHELGHYMLHSSSPAEYEFIDYRGNLASAGTDPDEVYANKFAANLLMPSDQVRALAKEKSTAVEMAFRFGVSQEAMTYRLSNLRIKVD